MEQKQIDYSPNYLKIIWENWYKVAVGAVACAVAGALFTLLTPPTYQSTATLLVYPPLFKEIEESTTARRSPEQMQLQLDEMMPRTFPVETYQIIAKSEGLIKEVIDALELEGALVEEISAKLTVELVQIGRRTAQRGTVYAQTILFHARAKSPKLAADLARTWADKFKARIDDLGRTGIDETYLLIQSMWTKTKGDLDAAEKAYEKWRMGWNLDLMRLEKSSKEKSLTLLEDQLDTTEIQLADASGQVAALQQILKDEHKIEALNKAPSDDAYWILKKSASTTGENAIGSQDVLRTEEYNPNYTVARNLEIAAQRTVQGLQGKREKLISKVTELREEIAKLHKDIAEQETVEKQLQRDVTTFETTYQLVASKFEKGKIAKTSPTSYIEIAGKAVEPGRPTGSRRLLKVAAATLVGALLGIAYVVADYSIRMSPSAATG